MLIMNDQKIHLISLGCAKNLVDSEILTGGIKKANITLTPDPEAADTVIINTCGFLDQAREESVDVILESCELKRTGKIQRLIVMGCLSERYPSQLKQELPEVDHFFGTSDHHKILSLLTGKEYSQDDPMFLRSLLTPSHYAYVKIAEGCDNGCSFCSIPQMRGLQVSRPIDSIVTEVQQLQEQGVREFLIIAQDTTSYGWDLTPKVYLSDLLDALDPVLDSQTWLRLHYAHPAHLSHRIIEAMSRNRALVPYLDMPVQHASDRILASMRRGLNREGIERRIYLLREAIPDIRLRTTLIVGYPGETEEDFKALYDFVDSMRFDRLGVFTYSEEEGTSAFELADDIPQKVKDERKALLLDLQNEISLEKNQALVGQTLSVIVDEVGTDTSVGRTQFDSPEVDNIVKITSPERPGSFIHVTITDANAYELTGHPVSKRDEY